MPKKFQPNFRIIDQQVGEGHLLVEKDIGYAQDYVSSIDLPENTDGLAHQVWLEINACLKLAKNLTEEQLNNRETVSVCTDGETVSGGTPLKDLAKSYFTEFAQWANEKQLQGRVALVPIPSSVPRICNHTFVMALICRWWAEWASDGNFPCALQVCDLLERIKPVKQAHRFYLEINERKIEPHLESIGVLTDGNSAIPDDVTAVIIVDDVVTTGTQMNAVATILKGLEVVPDNVPVYGYAWARTVLLEPVK
ncbi:MAG: hypothetical protein MJK04_11720 [Psychrosphaera sp.]|nr:hypothetical protein [Psychrosphaera sp.]